MLLRTVRSDPADLRRVKAVLDTSPLQALHRAGVLTALRELYPGGIYLPGSVDAQTRSALASFGPALVPSLDELTWIRSRVVSEEALNAHMSPPAERPRRAREKRTAGLQCHGYSIDREEFEVVVLALDLGAVAITDDHSGLRAAFHLGVPTETTYEVLVALSGAHLVDAQVPDLLARIKATGYHPTEKRARSRLDRSDTSSVKNHQP